ncbi:hypothetical protein L3H46_03755 [Corynebacterium sp. MC-07]|nr:hypothetical protein [Corynebacterium pseudokroppenstedtii]MCF6793168.1 hypothetical protein [Corynebacterium pseudokroppenstedtii]
MPSHGHSEIIADVGLGGFGRRIWSANMAEVEPRSYCRRLTPASGVCRR